MNDEEIMRAVIKAIGLLRNEQPSLEFNVVHERSTAHRLAVQMEPFFPAWNVDCEYDRHGQVRKLLAGIRACNERRATERILPDIVVHHRGNTGPEHNLLVVEIKKDASADPCDLEKLRRMTQPRGSFGYRLGLYINLNQGRFDCNWFKNGAAIEYPDDIESSETRNPRRASCPYRIDGICLEGFSEPVSIDALRAGRYSSVPKEPGIYMVIRASDSQPCFLDQSTGGWFKGRDPSYDYASIRQSWVDGAQILYVGMSASKKGLKGRLCAFFDFGLGKRTGHRGGRMLWHLQDSGQLLVQWRLCSKKEADSAETNAIADFKAAFGGRRPFANKRK
jgi:hypothetical protein